MALVARFKGGPRNGKKNNLRNHDEFPREIPVPAEETKAVNMSPGRYVLCEIEVGAENDQARYTWRASH